MVVQCNIYVKVRKMQRILLEFLKDLLYAEVTTHFPSFIFLQEQW